MDPTKAPRVYIILLNWNGWKDTIECIASLKALRYPNFEIIVVDNASENHSVQEIKNRYPKLTLIENAENRGFSAGNNTGIRYALKRDADYVWLLNNDTVVEPEALTPLVDKMEKNPSMGICGSKLIYYHQRDTVQVLGGGNYNKWLGVSTHFGKHSPVNSNFDTSEIEKKLDFIVGASMLVSRSFLMDVGLLCEDYFMYGEEIDWGIRAKGKYSFGFAPHSIVYHKEGASIGATSLDKDNKSRLADYYSIRNRFKITYKFHLYMLPFVYATMGYVIFNRIKRKQWDRIPMILKLLFTFNGDDGYEG
jgi:GT2 family glycosyltransferase